MTEIKFQNKDQRLKENTVEKPKVTIVCAAYNQKNYIKQALNSFIMQKTNFDFEVLINDDASTDGTTEIIKEYESKYPKIVKGVYHKENEYSKGMRGIITRNLLPLAKGDYIALCDGDDYYTDANKLRLQVEYLENNTDCSICFHRVRFFYEKNEFPDGYYPKNKKYKFTNEELLKRNFIPMNSAMYRRMNYAGFATNVFPEDWYLHQCHARMGKIGFIDKVMSAYRLHSAGVWWGADKSIDVIIKRHGFNFLALYFEFVKLYHDNEKFTQILIDRIIQLKLEMKKNGINYDKYEKKYMLKNDIKQKIEIREKKFLTIIKIHICLRAYDYLLKIYKKMKVFIQNNFIK